MGQTPTAIPPLGPDDTPGIDEASWAGESMVVRATDVAVLVMDTVTGSSEDYTLKIGEKQFLAVCNKADLDRLCRWEAGNSRISSRLSLPVR